MVLTRVRETIATRGLLTPGDHVLVACSGGGDSVALVDLLHRLAPELGISLHVVSFDHGLRAESVAEVELVRELAAALALPFTTQRFDLERGPGIQARARELRYQALGALRTEIGATKVATGHTRDDQAETVLGRALRGHGLEGLAGVLPSREDGVIRPLIDCARDELREHLERAGRAYLDDPSNDDPFFARVRLRTLLGELASEDPRVREHLARLADDAREAATLLDQRARELLATAGDAEGIDRAALAAAPGVLQDRAWRLFLRSELAREVSHRVLASLRELVVTGRGEVRLATGVGVHRDGGRLVLARNLPPTRAGG